MLRASFVIYQSKTNSTSILWRRSVLAIDSSGRTICIADAHRDDGKRFVVRADEKLTAFLELESVIHRPPPISDRRKLDNFLFKIGLSFAFRDECLDSFVDYIGDPHTVSLCYLAKPSQLSLVKPIERPASFKNKGHNIGRSGFWRGFHAGVFRCFLRPRKKRLPNNRVTYL
jgi:hypothetical protein